MMEVLQFGTEQPVQWCTGSSEDIMEERSLYPGWWCVCKHGDAELVRTMLDGHGIEVQLAPITSLGPYSEMAVWVREADFERATNLIARMADAMLNPPSGSWRCRWCGEDVEGQFDICWNCGRES
jgi:hypothetical protein